MKPFNAQIGTNSDIWENVKAKQNSSVNQISPMTSSLQPLECSSSSWNLRFRDIVGGGDGQASGA